MSKLVEMHARYEAIMNADKSPTERDLALATLMDQIKREFNVPHFTLCRVGKKQQKGHCIVP